MKWNVDATMKTSVCPEVHRVYDSVDFDNLSDLLDCFQKDLRDSSEFDYKFTGLKVEVIKD